MTGKNWGRCWNLPVIFFLELTQRSPWEWKLECKPRWRLTSPSWYAICSCFHYWLNCWKCNPEWEAKLKSVVKIWLILFNSHRLVHFPASDRAEGSGTVKKDCFWLRILHTDRKFSQKCWASQLCTRSTPQGLHQLISALLPCAVIFSKSRFLFLLKPKGFCEQGH